MNTLSRLHTIPSPAGTDGSRRAQVVRVVVTNPAGADTPRLVLAPGDRLLVENRTTGPLQVVPVDFFGTAFDRVVLEPGETTAPLGVTGLWFQVELRAPGPRVFPLDVYLAANAIR
ncbi:MAG: hypothetical protein R3B81_07240 [bacterium]